MKKHAKIVLGVSLFLAGTNVGYAQQEKTNPYEAKHEKEYARLFQKYEYLSNKPVKELDSLVASSIPSALLQRRLDSLNKRTPFELIYNERVHAFINLYINKKRELSKEIIGATDYYFPLIEKILDEEGMPLELKNLAIVESALKPKARSRVGAVGLWQFMYYTGKMYNLKVTSYYDERQDPVKSTHAACKYVQALYDMYNNWELAIAAYNCGPGNVNKAIRRSGGKKNYWEIYPYLPRETRGYVPAFIAVNYLVEHFVDHNITPTQTPYKYFDVDTTMVAENISYNYLAKKLGVDSKELSALNPELKTEIVPGGLTPYPFVLPRKVMRQFEENRDTLFAEYKTVKPEIVAYKQIDENITHRVRSGEVLGTIARRYGVSVSSIKNWNSLRSDMIRPGQRLIIYKKQRVAVTAQNTKSASPKTEKKTPVSAQSTQATGNYVYYTIQPGDTLWDIASRHKGVTVSELKRLNGVYNVRNLKPGQKIKISQKG